MRRLEGTITIWCTMYYIFLKSPVLNEIDAPTPFSLDRKNDRGRMCTCTTCVCLTGGLHINCFKMWAQAVNFYKRMYAAEDCDLACVVELLEGLLKLSSTQRSELDSHVTFQELSDTAWSVPRCGWSAG